MYWGQPLPEEIQNKINNIKEGLPKWPQCIITGDSVTREQALEIIQRTDTFLDGYDINSGNNFKFIEEAKKILKFPKPPKEFNGLNDKYHKEIELFQLKNGWLRLEYLNCNWISSCYIGGPNGWCHPDGSIGYSDNIGKWPEFEEVYTDLEAIAKAFPYLNITCTLLSDEGSLFDDNEDIEGKHSVITYIVKDGKVDIADTPIPIENLDLMAGRTHKTTEEVFSNIFSDDMSYENYFTLNELKTWNLNRFEIDEKKFWEDYQEERENELKENKLKG